MRHNASSRALTKHAMHASVQLAQGELLQDRDDTTAGLRLAEFLPECLHPAQCCWLPYMDANRLLAGGAACRLSAIELYVVRECTPGPILSVSLRLPYIRARSPVISGVSELRALEEQPS